MTFDGARRKGLGFLFRLVGMVAVTLFAVTSGLPLAQPAAAADVRSPEVKLIDDYNYWFIVQGAYRGDIAAVRARLPQYITNQTVLHEAESLPWGGVMVGYDGWARLCQISGPIWGAIDKSLSMSGAHQYQQGNVVINEITVTIVGTKASPKPFVMAIMEKYTVENGRIARIDEFYSDTAGFLTQLRLLGALPTS